eukprot:scaffold22004_cov92-Isochrysis_galbana.AAC.2
MHGGGGGGEVGSSVREGYRTGARLNPKGARRAILYPLRERAVGVDALRGCHGRFRTRPPTP